MTVINRLRAPHNTVHIRETAKFLFKRRLRAGAKYHSHDRMSAPIEHSRHDPTGIVSTPANYTTNPSLRFHKCQNAFGAGREAESKIDSF